MPDTPLADMVAASALDGTELLYTVQSASDRKATPAQLATYVAGTAAVAEAVRDTMGTALTAGSNITITPNDGSDTITIAATGGVTFPLAANGGTVTASNPVLDITQTWNNAAVNFTGLKANFTLTAAGASSILMELQTGGTSRFQVDRNGLVVAADFQVGGTIATPSSASMNFGSNQRLRNAARISWSANSTATSTQDVGIGRSAAGVLEITDGNTSGTRRDLIMRDLTLTPSASKTPANNGELTIEATSNTSVTIKLKGSDGTVRSVALTLA